MAINRQGAGLAIVRICIGLFFIFEGLSKLRWFVDSSILAGQLNGWLQNVGAGSISHRYLETIAIPWTVVFARLVPAGELACGVSLLLGVWTSVFAALAFFMVMNFSFASGVLLKYSFLTNGYGLPVIGSTLGLALGGVRLPWSLRG